MPMNKIEKLIKELCPNGVEWKKIGEIAYISDYVSAGTSIRENVTYKDNPDFAVLLRFADFSNGFDKSKFVYVDEHAYKFLSKSNLYPGDIVISNVGSCGLMFRCPDLGTKITLAPNSIVFRAENNAFFYYWLTTEKGQKDIERITSKSAMPKFNKTQFKEILVPYPPLPIQTEIVRILDKFVEQQEQLERLIELRKKQYEYYREEMLKPKEGEKWKTVTIGDLGTITRGRRFVRDDVRESGMPCIHYGDMYTYYGITARTTKTFLDRNFPKKMQYAKKGDVVVVGAGENDLDIGVGTVWEGEEPAAVHDACYILEHKQNPKYIAYFLRTNNYHQQLRKYVSDGKICSISGKGLGSCIISIPSLKKQEGIVEFLDKFESSIATLTSALEASKKRYEYYRDEMLGF